MPHPDPTDADLVERTRDGDTEAYGVLFARHVEVARRVAARTVRASEVDDVVAEAFTAMLAQLRRGGGPSSDARAYVLTSVRHEAARRAIRHGRLLLCDDMESYAGVPAPDRLEHPAVAAAYRSLPRRWREVLWQLSVEGRKPHELAAELGLSPNAVSALGCRARARLRHAIAEGSVAA